MGQCRATGFLTKRPWLRRALRRWADDGAANVPLPCTEPRQINVFASSGCRRNERRCDIDDRWHDGSTKTSWISMVWWCLMVVFDYRQKPLTFMICRNGRHLSKMMVLQWWWWWWWWWWWDALWAKLWLKTLPAMSVPDIFSEAELHTLCRSHAGLTTLLLRLAVDKYKTWFTKPFRPAAVYGEWPLLTWGGHHGILRACTSRRY